MTDWTDDAECKGKPGHIFFPDDTRGRPRDGNDLYARARAICHRCPVVQECLNDGLDELHGMWGGLSPNERQELRRYRWRGVAS